MQDHFTMLHIENSRAFLYPFGDKHFWKHVNFNGPTPEHRPELGSCWLWTASVNEWGYGRFRLNNSRNLMSTHRFSYEQTYGEIVGDWFVCHHCDMTRCVNPAHLWLGDAEMNNRDKITKGRAVNPVPPRGDAHHYRTHPEIVPRGEGHSNALLTEASVREMRARYAAGGVTYEQLAPDYGVNEKTIGKVIRRELWKHIIP